MKLQRLVFYPLLAAAYPVLALAAANSGEIPGLWVLTLPIGISVAVAVVGWLVLGLIVHNPDRRAFLTFMIVVLFASHGYFSLALEKFSWAAGYSHTILPFLLNFCYLSGITYLTLKLVPSLRHLTRFLTILSVILVLWNGMLILRQQSQWSTLEQELEAPASVNVQLSGSKGSQDIYLIVLDKYTGGRSLRENFDFDNSKFETFLVERGFVVPSRAQANYIYTGLSLASLLNYRYLDDLPALPSAQSRNKSYVNHVVEDNAVWRFLRARNYKFIFFPTSFPFTARNRFADVQVPDPKQIPSEFEMAWRRTTIAEPVLNYACRRIHCAGNLTPFTDDATFLERRFVQLGQVPTWPRDGRPLFVFAHLTIPHEPYLFSADCTVHAPFWPSYFTVSDEAPEKEGYIAQIACLNRRLKAIVGHLLSDSPSPPIILLQSDHGHGRMPLHIPDIDAVTPDRVAERADIFAAYYLPGADAKIVYDSISPVNVFRMVLRQYFQVDLPTLPDRTYWSPGTDLFRFTRVQDGRPLPQ